MLFIEYFLDNPSVGIGLLSLVFVVLTFLIVLSDYYKKYISPEPDLRILLQERYPNFLYNENNSEYRVKCRFDTENKGNREVILSGSSVKKLEFEKNNGEIFDIHEEILDKIKVDWDFHPIQDDSRRSNIIERESIGVLDINLKLPTKSFKKYIQKYNKADFSISINLKDNQKDYTIDKIIEVDLEIEKTP